MKLFFEKRLLPAVTLFDADTAKRLAETYLRAGLDVMEITFRSDATLSAIKAVARTFPEMKIGAGTILHPRQVQFAKDAGAQFGLSPGFNERVARSAKEKSLPFVPGVMTPSEVEKGLDMGFRILKLFPADIAGGVRYIHSLQGPYAKTEMHLIPMGGVSTENLAEYLACDRVLAAGGSWLAPKAKIEQGDFTVVENIVRRSLEIAGR
ncbi:MAG: bifunctional 4-hydroxy-2-oxoglutarate aldolase/2-dehydro-3-deoxy-phosphogluconate aldolase [Balneolaceae bacterium]|nr:bifunctional 4-hydroxy-2-oxoglutarate aldolase/2-dehydro-3-deoxy-phosphogluconate aldolase [Balneolaceae bacterium]